MPPKSTLSNSQREELDIPRAFSPAEDWLETPPAPDPSVEGGRVLSALSRQWWPGLALSLSLAGLVWLLKLEADPEAEAWQESLPSSSQEPASPETGAPSRGYPAWATSLLLMLGLAGAASLQQRQLSRHPWGAKLAEPIPPSVYTLSSALQQNYELKKAQLRQAFEAGQISTGEGPRGILEHEVQPGETLWRLSQMYQLDAAAITVSNRIQASTPLQPGQKLLIPSQPGLIYTVKQGDTLEDIANRYGVPQQRIIEATPLDRPEYLRIGQRLLIPGDVGELIRREKEMIAAQKAREEKAQRQAAEQARLQAEERRRAQQGRSLTHTVEAGDTIERIAARYGVTQRSIIQANNLHNPHWLRIGQRLMIPAPGRQLPLPTPVHQAWATVPSSASAGSSASRGPQQGLYLASPRAGHLWLWLPSRSLPLGDRYCRPARNPGCGRSGGGCDLCRQCRRWLWQLRGYSPSQRDRYPLRPRPPDLRVQGPVRAAGPGDHEPGQHGPQHRASPAL
jgi:LysM repeat protein